MRKINWMARADHEFVPNYKVLQAAFDKNSIEKHIDVGKLIRAKYQDNLEFLQWMKCYWDREGATREDYDPVCAREGKSLPPWARSSGCPGAPPCAGGVARERHGGEKENMKPRVVAPKEAKVGGPAAAMAGRASPVVSRPASAKAQAAQ